MIDVKEEIKNYLNQTLADLTVAARNVQQFHWNLKSENFISVHPYFGEIYENIANYIDEVAELLRIYEIYPIASLYSCLHFSQIPPLDVDGAVTQAEAIQSIIDEIEALTDVTNSSITFADNNELWDIVQTLSNHVQYYGKVLYFLKNSL